MGVGKCNLNDSSATISQLPGDEETRYERAYVPVGASPRFPHGLALYRGRIVWRRCISSVLVAGPVGAATWPRVVVFCGLGEFSGAAPAW